MKRFLLAVAAASSLGLPAFAQQIPVVEKQLPNGFKLLLVERHEEPRIAGGWVAHVGSANERPGITGIAHLFEHMMFKGTPTLGTKDAKRDLELIAQQEVVRDKMRAEESLMRAALRRGDVDDITKPEARTERYKTLEIEFKKLVDEQRSLLVKNEFDRIYTTAGASKMNAFTTEDMTGYFIEVPSNKLELWCWMESERLFHPVFREFYAERDVVFEERRMRTEVPPTGRAEEQFNAMFWDAHPYHWPVIGWPSDIPAITKKQADEFYALFYQPQNITLILVGDFKAADAEDLATRYFGRIPQGEQPAPEVGTLEIASSGEKRYNAEAETNPQLEVLWHTVAAGHRDSYALEVLDQLLNGRTGRLYKGLVLGRQIATDAGAGLQNRKWAGLFAVSAEAKEGKSLDEVEAALYAELDRITKEPIPPEELQKVKNQFAAAEYRRLTSTFGILYRLIHAEAKEGKSLDEVEAALYAELDRITKEPIPPEELQKVKNQFAAAEYRRLTSTFGILYRLIHAEGVGGWREINEAGPKIQAVTVEDVQRVAAKYLVKENRAVARFTRKPGTGSTTDDSELAGLSAEQKPIARNISTSVKQEKDPKQLKELLARVEAQAAQGDPKRQQFAKFIRGAVQRRLAELEPKK